MGQPKSPYDDESCLSPGSGRSIWSAHRSPMHMISFAVHSFWLLKSANTSSFLSFILHHRSQRRVPMIARGSRWKMPLVGILTLTPPHVTRETHKFYLGGFPPLVVSVEWHSGSIPCVLRHFLGGLVVLVTVWRCFGVMLLWRCGGAACCAMCDVMSGVGLCFDFDDFNSHGLTCFSICFEFCDLHVYVFFVDSVFVFIHCSFSLFLCLSLSFMTFRSASEKCPYSTQPYLEHLILKSV